MTLPTRSNGQRITAAWFNSIKTEIETSGSTVSYESKTIDYTITSTDVVIGIDSSSGAVTITLPAASVAIQGRRYWVLVEDATNACILDANGAETINGSANYTFSRQYESVGVVCDGTGWIIFDQYTTTLDAANQYLGNPTTNGTIRLTNDSGTLKIYERVAGTYVLKGEI
jgi:hypothetical protein